MAAEQSDAPEERCGEIDVHFGDNLALLEAMPDASYDLIYIDPPFNTGREQSRTQIRTVRDAEEGDRVGFKGQRYRTVRVGTKSFGDSFDDFSEFIAPRLEQARRLLTGDDRHHDSHQCQ